MNYEMGKSKAVVPRASLTLSCQRASRRPCMLLAGMVSPRLI